MKYKINSDVKYGPLEIVDAGKLADDCADPWWNQTLCRVNDCVARLGVFEGEFHWHSHEREDEFFYVIEGNLLLDVEGKTFSLLQRQGIMVPRRIRHRTRAPVRTIVLMVESSTVTPTGD